MVLSRPLTTSCCLSVTRPCAGRAAPTPRCHHRRPDPCSFIWLRTRDLWLPPSEGGHHRRLEATRSRQICQVSTGATTGRQSLGEGEPPSAPGATADGRALLAKVRSPVTAEGGIAGALRVSSMTYFLWTTFPPPAAPTSVKGSPALRCCFAPE